MLKIKLLTLAATCLILTSCALAIPNLDACVDLGQEAVCRETISGKERSPAGVEWENERTGRISLTPEDFGKVKKFILKACEIMDNCTKEGVEEMLMFIYEIENTSRVHTG